MPRPTGQATPSWILRALDLYSDHSLPSDCTDLRGQYAENRIFLQRIVRDYNEGLISRAAMHDLEEIFTRACARPEGDPVLALEEHYLRLHDAQLLSRQAQRPALRVI